MSDGITDWYRDQAQIDINNKIFNEQKENIMQIKWFLELALKLRDNGYSDSSIYSIDIQEWDNYRRSGYIPNDAIKEDESNA